MSALSQQLRTRVLDVLALVADEASQRRYQAAVPHVEVPAELFNQWDESFFPSNSEFQKAFGVKEMDALQRFDSIMRDISAKTPKQLPPLDRFITTRAWHELSKAARIALGEIAV